MTSLLRIPAILRLPGAPEPDISGFIQPICIPVRIVWRRVQPTVPVEGPENPAVELVPVQSFLLTPRFPLLAEPPKGIMPRLMERIPNQSGREAARDTPSWARGTPRRVGETPRDYAQRLMDEQYGPRGWDRTDTGPKSEFNKIRKYGERAFQNPKLEVLLPMDKEPEA